MILRFSNTIRTAFLLSILTFSLLWASQGFAETPLPGEPKLYMLADAIPQRIPVDKFVILKRLGISATYTSLPILSAYHLSGGKISAAITMAAYEYATEAFTTPGYLKLLLELDGKWKDKANLQKIANLEGVDKIHIFTAGYTEYRGVYPKALNNLSLIFVESKGEPPPDVLGSKWVELNTQGNSKIRISMNIKGEPVGESVEVPVHEFLYGMTLDPKIKESWLNEIREWVKPIPILKRPFKNARFAKEVSLHGTLVTESGEKSLGEIAAGKGIYKTLDVGVLNWIKRLFLRVNANSPTHFARTFNVLPPDSSGNPCVIRLKNLFSSSIRREQ